MRRVEAAGYCERFYRGKGYLIWLPEYSNIFSL
jgi:hypothetical protein